LWFYCVFRKLARLKKSEFNRAIHKIGREIMKSKLIRIFVALIIAVSFLPQTPVSAAVTAFIVNPTSVVPTQMVTFTVSVDVNFSNAGDHCFGVILPSNDWAAPDSADWPEPPILQESPWQVYDGTAGSIPSGCSLMSGSVSNRTFYTHFTSDGSRDDENVTFTFTSSAGTAGGTVKFGYKEPGISFKTKTSVSITVTTSDTYYVSSSSSNCSGKSPCFFDTDGTVAWTNALKAFANTSTAKTLWVVGTLYMNGEGNLDEMSNNLNSASLAIKGYDGGPTIAPAEGALTGALINLNQTGDGVGNITVQDLTFNGADGIGGYRPYGLEISTDSGTTTIQNVTTQNSDTNVHLDASSATVDIQSCTITNSQNGHGIFLEATTGPVTIQNNTISNAINGSDLYINNTDGAVEILNNNITQGEVHGIFFWQTSDTNVKFNNILDSGDYGITLVSVSASATVNIEANNITGNNGASDGFGNTAQVNNVSSAHPTAGHNYWGLDATSAVLNGSWGSAGDTDAEFGRRLGAAIAVNTGSPGVQAKEYTDATTKTAYWPVAQAGISFQTNQAINFTVINHEYASAPFGVGQGGDEITQCSRYYDVYYNEDPGGSTTMNIYLKYDRSSSCLTNVEAMFSGAPGVLAGSIPLWWYDPSPNQATDKWDQVSFSGSDYNTNQGFGYNGDGDSCGTYGLCMDKTNNYIRFTVNGTGSWPGNSDLFGTPFVVGNPKSPTAITLTNFTAESNARWLPLSIGAGLLLLVGIVLVLLKRRTA
jgi:hypothetical protein